MLTELFNSSIYCVAFLSLFAIDYLLGNGFVDLLQKLLCKMMCFVKNTIKVEEKQNEINNDNANNILVVLAEMMFLGLTIAFLNKCKVIRGKNRINDLLQESREALRQTNEILEKWRLRRININCELSSECSYLDDEPQEIKPYKLEVPILHMAIIDTLGKSRNQQERGDAGDTINRIDTTLISMTSLLDDDLESISEPPNEEEIGDPNCIKYGNRFLWDVMEEDLAIEE